MILFPNVNRDSVNEILDGKFGQQFRCREVTSKPENNFHPRRSLSN